MTRWLFRIIVRSAMFAPPLSKEHDARCVCMVCCQPVLIDATDRLWFSAREKACLVARERYGEVIRILEWSFTEVAEPAPDVLPNAGRTHEQADRATRRAGRRRGIRR